MPEAKRKKRSNKQVKERKERRFVPEATYTSKLAFGGGLLGAFVLGAGVYAKWIRDPELAQAPYIVAAGAVALGAALWFGDAGVVPVRVGDAGVGVEKGTEVTRLAWCDMQRVSEEKGNLLIAGEGLTLSLPLGAHARAIAWILKEAAQRVPEVLDVKPALVDLLPKPNDDDGEAITPEALQITGRRCAASSKVISFERDARLCPTCAQVYHKDHVPVSCVTCDQNIKGRVLRA